MVFSLRLNPLMATTSSTTHFGPSGMASSIVIDYVSEGSEEGSCYMLVNI